MDQYIHAATRHVPWNKGELVGQKAPLKLKDIWAIRVRLQTHNRTRELALFNLAIDSKLRSCDLVKLRVRDVCHGSVVATRAMVMQQKTQPPVQFETTEQTRESLLAWIRDANRRSDDYLFPSRIHGSPHLSTRQYARIVRGWVREIGLDSSTYGTHTMRRTKASLIYRRTKNALRKFAAACADKRNEISHYGGRRHEGNYDNELEDLHKKSDALSNLYHILLLREIGVDDQRLHALATRGLRSFAIKSSFGLLPASALKDPAVDAAVAAARLAAAGEPRDVAPGPTTDPSSPNPTNSAT
jgi:hypothetical protein